SSILFHVSFVEPQAHYVEMQMEVQGFDQDFVDLKMPVWTPGSYLIREFAKNVEKVTAQQADGQSLTIYKINKNTWRVEQPGSHFLVNYRVYSFEKSVRTNF